MRRFLQISLVVVLVCLTVLRLWGASAIELFSEDAYYWIFSQHLALGYYDHPPMVGWVVRAGTFLLGDTELGVRLLAPVFSLLSCALIFLTGRLWFDERSALVATLLFALAPLFVGTGLIMTPDVPLILFWVAAMYAISNALLTGGTGWWLASGVAFGGAMLSKYSAVMLGPSLLLFLLLSPVHRHWLRRPQPWLAAVVALLVFSPVIYWNAQHEWASFLFQATRAAKQQGGRVENIAWFFGSQILVVTPPVFALCAWALARGVRRGWFGREDRWNFVASFCLPMLLVLFTSSFNKRIHPNWPCLIFPSLLLGAGALLVEGLTAANATAARWWRRGAWLTAITLLVAAGLGASTLLWGKPEVFLPRRAGGWRDLAGHVRAARTDLARRTGQQPFVFGADKLQTPSPLAFYLCEPRDVVNVFILNPQNGFGFRGWTDLDKLVGRPAVTVTDKVTEKLLQELRTVFVRVDPPRPVEAERTQRSSRAFYLIDCYGYHR